MARPGDLQPDRQAAARVAAVDARRRLLAHVEGQREADVLERPRRVVGGAGEFGGVGGDRRGRRDHHVEGRASGHRGVAHRAHLAVAAEHLFAAEAGTAARPLDDEGQHLGAARLGQRGDVHPAAAAPEVVHAVDHGARHEGAHGLDDGTGAFEQARCRLHRGACVGLHRQAPAGVELQADAQALHLAVQLLPGDVLPGQAHRVTRIGAAEHAHHQRGIGHGACHRPGHAAGVGRVDGDAAEAGLEGEDAAPGRRQAHRAADVGAQVQRPVAGGGTRTRAGAAAARVLRQVPGVARERVEARQPRGQHAVVGHRRLAQDDRAGFAQPCGGRCVLRRGHQLGGGGAQRHRHALRRDVLLDHRRHAVERTERLALQPARLRGFGLHQRRLGVERVGGMQVRLPAADVAQHRARHLHRRGGLAVVEVEQRDGGEVV